MTQPDTNSKRKRVVQVSFVVEDLYESVQAFLDLYEIGPWLLFEHYPMKDLRYRGSTTTMDFSLAVAFSGSMMFELIQQNDDTPSGTWWRVQGHGGHPRVWFPPSCDLVL